MQPEPNYICDIVESIWRSVVGLDLERTTGTAMPDGEHRFLTGCVQITGGWEGAVMLDCSAALARRTAGIMLDVDMDAASIEEIHDALGELANMAAGNLKTMLPGPCQLSLPAVIEGIDYKMMVPGSQLLVRVSYTCRGEPLTVTLLKGDKHPHQWKGPVVACAKR